MLPTSDPTTTPLSEGAELPPSAPQRGAAIRPSRRVVLRSAGLSAVVGGTAIGLAACGAEGSPAAPTTSAAPASSAPASSAAAPSSAASSAAASGPGVAAADVPVGGGVILSDADYVITQPTEGEFKAFSKMCTHRGCEVGKVESEEIVCPCHGSKFSIADGSVTSGPATAPLEEFDVTVSGDQVSVAG